jgi:hypothetical protein
MRSSADKRLSIIIRHIIFAKSLLALAHGTVFVPRTSVAPALTVESMPLPVQLWCGLRQLDLHVSTAFIPE